MLWEAVRQAFPTKPCGGCECARVCVDRGVGMAKSEVKRKRECARVLGRRRRRRKRDHLLSLPPELHNTVHTHLHRHTHIYIHIRYYIIYQSRYTKRKDAHQPHLHTYMKHIHTDTELQCTHSHTCTYTHTHTHTPTSATSAVFGLRLHPPPQQVEEGGRPSLLLSVR